VEDIKLHPQGQIIGSVERIDAHTEEPTINKGCRVPLMLMLALNSC